MTAWYPSQAARCILKPVKAHTAGRIREKYSPATARPPARPGRHKRKKSRKVRIVRLPDANTSLVFGMKHRITRVHLVINPGIAVSPIRNSAQQLTALARRYSTAANSRCPPVFIASYNRIISRLMLNVQDHLYKPAPSRLTRSFCPLNPPQHQASSAPNASRFSPIAGSNRRSTAAGAVRMTSSAVALTTARTRWPPTTAPCASAADACR